MDGFSGHGVDHDTLAVIDPECLAVMRLYNLEVLVLKHNTSASTVGGDPLDAHRSINKRAKAFRREILAAIGVVWNEPCARLHIPDDAELAAAEKRHQRASYVEYGEVTSAEPSVFTVLAILSLAVLCRSQCCVARARLTRAHTCTRARALSYSHAAIHLRPAPAARPVLRSA